jgi:tetraacyldisaccharide 4'-kinase
MKTPSFWYSSDKNSLCATLLSPLAALYTKGDAINRGRSHPQPVASPVICLGNLVAGGSGKTPTAIALMKLIKDRNFFLSPAFVTRGYGGKIVGPERVDDTHNQIFWGDEAILLARHATTYVSANRFEGADAAVFNGADAVLLDDGLQNYDLVKDVSFAVVDGKMGFGNERVIPAGPLRQPLGDGMARADAFILIGDDERDVLSKIPADKPVFRARLQVREPQDLPHGAYIAFCGIGFPDKFRATLDAQKINCVGFHAYADHHAFTIDDMTKLVEEALEKKARLLTTEKDYVRLPDFTMKQLIDVLPVEIIFENPDALLDFIRVQCPTSQTT